MAELITNPTFVYHMAEDYGSLQVVFHNKEIQIIDEYGADFWLSSSEFSKFAKEVEKHLKEVQKMKKQ